MKTFEIRTPDGRILRHEANSIEECRARLLPGYQVVAQVIGAAADGRGGWTLPVDGPTLMSILLEAHGDELLAWLEKRGVQPVERPRDENGRWPGGPKPGLRSSTLDESDEDI